MLHIVRGLDQTMQQQELLKSAFHSSLYMGEIPLSRKLPGDQYDIWEELSLQLPTHWNNIPALKTVYAPVQSISEYFTYNGYIVTSKGFTTATKGFNIYTGVLDIEGDTSEHLSIELNEFLTLYLLNTKLYPTNNIPYLEQIAWRLSKTDPSLEHPFDRIVPQFISGAPSFVFASSEGSLVLPDFYEEYPLMGRVSTTIDPNYWIYKGIGIYSTYTDDQLDALRIFRLIPEDSIHPLKSNIACIEVRLNLYEEDKSPLIMTLFPQDYSYDPSTRQVTINKNVFERIKSIIRDCFEPYSGQEKRGYFEYKINIETGRSIYDPNDDLSDAQAQKIALMQAVQLYMLQYYNEFTQGAARAQIDFETVYTVTLTTISTAITLAVGIAASSAFAAEEVISSSIQQVVPAATRGSLIAAQVVLSVASENLEELFLDPLIESVVTDLVKDLGGDEKAQVIASVLAESIREGLMGTVADFSHINIMNNLQNLVFNHYQEAIMSTASELATLHAFSEYQQLLAEQPGYTLGPIPLSALSTLTLFIPSMIAESFYIRQDATSGEVLHFLRGLTDFGIKGDFLRSIIRNMHTADSTAEIIGTQEIAPGITAEVSNPVLLALKNVLEDIASSRLASIQDKKPCSQEDINVLREQFLSGEIGIEFTFMYDGGGIDYGGDMGIPFGIDLQNNKRIKKVNTQSQTHEKTMITSIFNYQKTLDEWLGENNHIEEILLRNLEEIAKSKTTNDQKKHYALLVEGFDSRFSLKVAKRIEIDELASIFEQQDGPKFKEFFEVLNQMQNPFGARVEEFIQKRDESGKKLRYKDARLFMDDTLLESIKEDILQNLIRATGKSKYFFEEINPKTFEKFVKYYQENDKEFYENYLQEGFSDMLLKYFVNFEVPFLIWSQYLEQDQTKLTELKDFYMQNWDKDAKNLQRIIWGVLLDCYHPLLGQKIKIADWVSLDLHHWMTASGHENKYSCLLFSVFPLPSDLRLGEPIHLQLTGQIENNPTIMGTHWENQISDVITAVLKGDVPSSTIWKDEEYNQKFDQYQKLNENARKTIIWLFLYSHSDLIIRFNLEKIDFYFK